MKTAISIPDGLNENIEAFLTAARISRSEFFQRAARAYLEKVSAKSIVTNLNEVYGESETPAEIAFRTAALSHFQDLIGKEEW